MAGARTAVGEPHLPHAQLEKLLWVHLTKTRAKGGQPNDIFRESSTLGFYKGFSFPYNHLTGRKWGDDCRPRRVAEGRQARVAMRLSPGPCSPEPEPTRAGNPFAGARTPVIGCRDHARPDVGPTTTSAHPPRRTAEPAACKRREHHRRVKWEGPWAVAPETAFGTMQCAPHGAPGPSLETGPSPTRKHPLDACQGWHFAQYRLHPLRRLDGQLEDQQAAPAAGSPCNRRKSRS